MWGRPQAVLKHDLRGQWYIFLLPDKLQLIKESLDKKFGTSWHVVVGRGFAYDVTYEVSTALLYGTANRHNTGNGNQRNSQAVLGD